MKVIKIYLFVFFGFIFSACPDGFYEDDCGNCWLAYCYDYMNHTVSYDTNQNECEGGTLMWVIPGDFGDPYFNSYCDSCPNGFTPDDCGHCWMSYCYTFFSPGLDGDPEHSVYYDLSQSECEDLGYGYYTPGNPADPYWNSNCDEGEADECESCMEGCVNYVMENYGYNQESAEEWCISTPNNQYGCADICAADCIIGDIDGNGSADVLDLVNIVQNILSPNGYYDECADFDSNNEINVLDLVGIISNIINNY